MVGDARRFVAKQTLPVLEAHPRRAQPRSKRALQVMHMRQWDVRLRACTPPGPGIYLLDRVAAVIEDIWGAPSALRLDDCLGDLIQHHATLASILDVHRRNQKHGCS